MKSMCDTCRRHRLGRDKDREECKIRQRVCEAMGHGVEICRDYVCAAIIEREDDGTERCSNCGALWLGWKVCPNCGADFRMKEAREAEAPKGEVTLVTTVQITKIIKGCNAQMDSDTRLQQYAKRIEAFIADRLGADNTKVTRVQAFFRDGE